MIFYSVSKTIELQKSQKENTENVSSNYTTYDR